MSPKTGAGEFRGSLLFDDREREGESLGASFGFGLRQGMERMIREHVPEVTEIHDVTDHDAGENPYFSR